MRTAARAFWGRGGATTTRTWSALATVGCEINDRWSVRASWRTVEISKEVNAGTSPTP